ncbi:MAG: helix-turn-helix domain-containing protein [Novosphingobium sp.]
MTIPLRIPLTRTAEAYWESLTIARDLGISRETLYQYLRAAA